MRVVSVSVGISCGGKYVKGRVGSLITLSWLGTEVSQRQADEVKRSSHSCVCTQYSILTQYVDVLTQYVDELTQYVDEITHM